MGKNEKLTILDVSTCTALAVEFADGRLGAQEHCIWRMYPSYFSGGAPDAAVASRIKRGNGAGIKSLCTHYIAHDGDTLLRRDMASFANAIVGTAKLRKLYLARSIELVEHASNLEPEDRDYILAYQTGVDETKWVAEILYRMLRVAIREPRH